ncbi:MAG: DUF4160 domain-containing protein [Phycisphaerae bacterium]
MPVISRFYGIVVAIYWHDHAPPHFHAKYGEYEVEVDIMDGVSVVECPRELSEWCDFGECDTYQTCWQIGTMLNAASR